LLIEDDGDGDLPRDPHLNGGMPPMTQGTDAGVQSTMPQKWSINKFYSQKLPNGQAFPAKNHNNPGLSKWNIDISKLTRLQEDHRGDMSPLQIVACFILQHICVLAYKKLVAGLFLTSHHGLPVVDDCNGSDVEVSSTCSTTTPDRRILSHPCCCGVQSFSRDRKPPFCVALLFVVALSGGVARLRYAPVHQRGQQTWTLVWGSRGNSDLV
jgi:hypothetical protein